MLFRWHMRVGNDLASKWRQIHVRISDRAATCLPGRQMRPDLTTWDVGIKHGAGWLRPYLVERCQQVNQWGPLIADEFRVYSEQRGSSERRLQTILAITILFWSRPGSAINAQYQVYRVTSLPEKSLLCLTHILRGLIEIWRKKWQERDTSRRRKFSESWQWVVIVT